MTICPRRRESEKVRRDRNPYSTMRLAYFNRHLDLLSTAGATVLVYRHNIDVSTEVTSYALCSSQNKSIKRVSAYLRWTNKLDRPQLRKFRESHPRNLIRRWIYTWRMECVLFEELETRNVHDNYGYTC